MNRTRKLLVAGAAALAAAGIAVGCGGDEGGDEDAAELLRTALGQDVEYDSGVINIGVDGSVEGVVSGELNAEINGPFQSGREGEAPELDLGATADVNIEGIPQLPGGSFAFDLDGGFALADDSLFVTYEDTTYEASQKLYSEVSPLLESATEVSGAAQDENNADEFIDSLENLENEGTEEVDGESLTHLSGDLDFAALAEEGAAGGQAPFDPADLEGLTSAVDLYVGDDDAVRRVDIGFNADSVEALSAAGLDGLDLTISVGISDPGSEQAIEAPGDTEPLDALLGQLGTSEADITDAIGQALQGLPPGGLPGAGEPGGGAELPELSDCLDQAQSDRDVQKCLEQ